MSLFYYLLIFLLFRFLFILLHFYLFIVNTLFSNKKIQIFFSSLTNLCFISAQDLRVNRPWERWPPHLALPMILMRESMKKSMIQSLTNTPSSIDAAAAAAALINKPRQSPRVTTSPSSNEGPGFDCSVCGRIYKLKSSLRNHQKWECGKEPQFKCPYCVYKAKQKMHMARHMERMHKEIDYSTVKSELSIKAESSEAE